MRHTRPWRNAGGAAGAACLILLLAMLAGGQAPPDEPLTLQRVALPLTRLAAELERVRQGVLVQMPRADFEDLVARAAQSAQAAKSPPRLARASYSAELVGNALTAGSGQWTLHHSGVAPGILPLPSFNLAVSKIKTASGGKDAVLGDIDGKNLGLLVEQAGDVVFDWSLRGAQTAAGLHFDIHVPPCPVALLELKLPADRQLSLVNAQALLTGPHEAEHPGKRIWRLQATGRSHIELLVTGSEAIASAPLVASQLQSRFVVIPERTLADFEFNIDTVQGGLRELIFDCDPSLQPYEVSARNADIKSWDYQQPSPSADGAKEGTAATATLTVQLRDAAMSNIQGLRLRFASGRSGERWSCPGVRLRGARQGGESLKVSVHPDVQFESWDFGGFRLLATSPDLDGSQVFSLTDPAIGLTPSPRPSVSLKTHLHDLHARQVVHWRLDVRGAVLEANFEYLVARGNVHQLAVKLPAPGHGWKVDDVQTSPPEYLRGWNVAGAMLWVDLERGLKPGKAVTLSMRMSAAAAKETTAVVDFPALEALDASHRDGVLSITLDPALRASLVKSSLTPILQRPLKEPAEKLSPVYVFRFQDKTPTGQLRIYRQGSQARVRCQQQVLLSPGKGAWEARLEIDPVAGSLAYLDLRMQAPWAAKSSLTSRDSPVVREVERLPSMDAWRGLLQLAPTLNWTRLGSLAPLAAHHRYRLHFVSPLLKPETVILQASLEMQRTAHDGAEIWSIPFLTAGGNEHLDGELALHSSGIEIGAATPIGLEDVSSTAAASGDMQRLFRWGAGAGLPAPQLTLACRPRPAAGSSLENCDDAHLTSYVREGDSVLHVFRFEAKQWRARKLPVLLPPGVSTVAGAKVDSRWIDQISQRETEHGILVDLPVSMERRDHRFEIFYVSRAAWSGWPARLTAEAQFPKLPTPARIERRTWRLAPGILPLHQEHLQALSPAAGAANHIAQAWRVGQPLLDQLLPVADHHTELQRQALSGAESGLRRKVGKDWTLGMAVDRLAVDYLKGQLAIIIDRAALEAAGILPDQPFSQVLGASSLWEPLGLVLVPLPSAVVLTTRSQAAEWRRLVGDDLADAFDKDVRDALRLGQDARGQFVSVPEWLVGRSFSLSSPALRDWRPLAETGWTEWATLSDMGVMQSLVVVETSSLGQVGFVLALVVVLLTLRLRRFLAPLWKIRLAILTLASFGVVLIAMPATLRPVVGWPFLTSVLLFAVGFLRWLWRGAFFIPARSGRSTDKAVKVALGALLLGAALRAPWPTLAQPAQPAVGVSGTVFLVEPEPGKQFVLASPELLKKLADLERGPASPTGAVLVAARYQGKLIGQSADFHAEFDFFSFSDKARLVAPLNGVDLREGAYLDGAPAFPTVATGAKSGYQVPVRGKGWHRLTLNFSAKVVVAAESSELRFQMPRLSQCRLELRLPAAFQGVQAASALGEVKLRQENSTQELRAELGRDSQAILRWRQESGPAAPAAGIEVREAYYWDLRPNSVSLAAILQYSAGKGNVGQLSIALPESLDVRSVEAYVPSVLPASSLLKRWRLQGKGSERLLLVELNSPTVSRVQLQLGLLPRLMLAPGSTVLHLPQPRSVKPTLGSLGYRMAGLEAEDNVLNLSIAGIQADVFAKEWAAFGVRDPGPATRAYSFRRFSANAGLTLKLGAPPHLAKLESIWTLYPQHAELAANLHVTSAEDLGLIEFTAPPTLRLARVQGPDVLVWSRTGDRVQVWLQQPRKQVDVDIVGWAAVSARPALGKKGRAVLPAMLPLNARLAGVVKVRPAAGVILSPEKGRIWEELPGEFRSAPSAAETAFQMTLEPVAPDIRTLTVVEPRDGGWSTVIHGVGHAAAADAVEVRLRLRNSLKSDVRLELPVEPVRRVHRIDGGDHVWDLVFSASTPRPFSFNVRVRSPGREKSFVAPRLSVEKANHVDAWVGIAKTMENETRGLAPLESPADELRPWPAEAARLARDGKTWRATEAAWSLTLKPLTQHETPPVAVAWAEHSASAGDGLRWVHQADWMLIRNAAGDIRVRMPPGANLLGLSVDGQASTPMHSENDVLIVPLPGPAAMRSLQIRWSYDLAAEPFSRPNLALPDLAGATRAPTQGRLFLPAGWRAAPLPSIASSSPAHRWLDRARGRMTLCKLLADQLAPAELLAQQKAFYWELSQAELWLPNLEADTERARVSLLTQELRKANLRWAKEKSLESIRAQSEKQPTSAAQHLAARPGRPLYWKWSPGEAPVTPALTDETERPRFAARQGGEAIVLTAIALLSLTYFPRSLAFLAGLWPEWCLAAAVLGTWLMGPSWIGLALAAAGLSARFLWLVRLARRLSSGLWKTQPSPQSQ